LNLFFADHRGICEYLVQDTDVDISLNAKGLLKMSPRPDV